MLDGIVFSGGADVDPVAYGADPHPETDEPQARRDAGELALLTAALERDMPTLAICRGFQLLNVARGGDLVQHLPETLGHDEHKQMPGTFTEPGRGEGGVEAGVDRGRKSGRTSHHHQSVGRLGEGLVETAWAEDGTIEGAEDPSRRFAVGVQWHPESGRDDGLFANLVEEARASAPRDAGLSGRSRPGGRPCTGGSGSSTSC